MFYFVRSSQVEKEKKKGMMDINLRYVAAVTSLRGDLTFLNHLLNIHTKVISSILRKNEHRRLKRKIALDMCKNGWALHYVVIKINDGVQFYLMAKVLAVRTFNRLNNRLYANSNGYAIHNNKGDQTSLFYCSYLGHIITWSWAHQKKVLKASILIAQMVIKLGVSTTKIKYLTEKYMIDQNV